MTFQEQELRINATNENGSMNEVAMGALIHNSSETVQRVNECAVTSQSFQEFRVSVIAQRDL